MDASAFGVLATFLVTVAGFAYTWFKDGRERRWAKEDAAGKAAHLASKIDVGVGAAADAFKEANSVNLKIHDLAVRLEATTLRVEAIAKAQNRKPRKRRRSQVAPRSQSESI